MTPIIESRHISRREFVKELAVATLVIQIAPLAQACDSLDEEDRAVTGNALIATSTEGLFGHFHRLSILRELLESPPAQGIAIDTTRALFHRHSVRLSAEDVGDRERQDRNQTNQFPSACHLSRLRRQLKETLWRDGRDRPGRSACGTGAGPMYVMATIAQALTRDG
jgi:hypothetical protein